MEPTDQLPRTCPRCNTPTLYRTTASSGGGYSPCFLPGLSPKWWKTATFEVVVCEKCGLTQFFAPPEARAKLSTTKQWTRL